MSNIYHIIKTPAGKQHLQDTARNENICVKKISVLLFFFLFQDGTKQNSRAHLFRVNNSIIQGFSNHLLRLNLKVR
jgi:hypothetical protein